MPPNDELLRRIETLEQQMREHGNDGVVGRQVQLAHVQGYFKTITTSADLTTVLASTPRRVIDQIVIDTSTATKKLYIFDTTGAVWRSCTIS